MRLCLEPSPFTAPTDNGIGRVLNAMGKYLPAYGVEFTADPENADVVAFHAGTALGTRVDVLHCHGLYWSDLEHSTFSRSNNVANQRIVAAARRAKVITVPSDWVAEPFRRDMRIEPEIVGHGITISEWKQPTEHGDYILWNKNRPTDVCDPTPTWRLAERGLKVVSTFGPNGKVIPNLTVVGQIPFEEMKPIIENADLYLATTPETFGIGTLEAMICGVPVLGYDWCGTHDLIKHKETGWLVYPHDIDGLMEGAAWLREHRAEISQNARAFAMNFDWSTIMGTYYDLYTRTMVGEKAGVSIVITNYNYARWIGDCIASCLWQQRPADEIIVVDDGSTDNSLEILKPFVDRKQIKLITQSNQGVAAARNHGIDRAQYPFIVCLDADDMLGPEYVAALRPALERDRGLGVAYPGVRFINEEGRDTGFNTYKPFSWEIQTKHEVPPPTCIPSGSMFRKSMWERCGGYKQKYAPGEDTEFWTHGLSLGFTAEMVTPETLFWYRGHDGSASRTRKYVEINDNKPWIEDKIYPMGAPAYYVPNVKSYINPLITVVTPVGPGHESLVVDAIESAIGQNIRDWELILIDDNNGKLDAIKKRYPFVKIKTTGPVKGAGAARNLGIGAAKGRFVLFLDADDWLRPDAMDLMLQHFSVNGGHYVYTDFYAVDGNGGLTLEHSYEYDREFFQTKQVMHSVTALVPTSWASDVGGFDPNLVGWEEYDFYMKLAVKGYCGACLHEPLLYYRLTSGTRRKISQKMEKELNSGFEKKFKGVEMAGCCGNGGEAILDAKRALGLIPRENAIPAAELPNEVRMEFLGPQMGPIGFNINGRTYYGANDGLHRFINAPREDADKLAATGKWRIILPPDEARIRASEPAPMQELAGPRRGG